MWAIQEILYFWGKTFGADNYAECTFFVMVGEKRLGYGWVVKTLNAEEGGVGNNDEGVVAVARPDLTSRDDTTTIPATLPPTLEAVTAIDVSANETEFDVGTGVTAGVGLGIKIGWVDNGKILCNEFRFFILLLQTLTSLAVLPPATPYPGESWYIRSADFTFGLGARNQGVLDDGEFNQSRAARSVEVLGQSMLAARKERQYREFDGEVRWGKRKVGFITGFAGEQKPEVEGQEGVEMEKRGVVRSWRG